MGPDDDLKNTLSEERAVKVILKKKMEALHSYSEGDSELLAYRLAEIIVLAKNLYTKLFNDLMKSDSRNEEETWSQVMGIRMHLLHLRDCIQDFETDLIDLMEDKKDGEDEEQD